MGSSKSGVYQDDEGNMVVARERERERGEKEGKRQGHDTYS